MAKNDLIFKYGEGDLKLTEQNQNAPGYDAGTVYVRKLSDTRGQMFVDYPGQEDARLQIGGEIFVGDPKEAGEDYEVVINPNGDVLEGVVTGLDSSENPMAYTIRVVEVEESALDSYTPTDANSNIITLVIKA